MMLFRPVFWFFVLFFYKIGRADASNVIDTEQKQLEKNLKVLRNDFNKIVETIEDFAGDFLIQIRETGKVMGNTYIGDNDYDWQDDNSNTIEKTTKSIPLSLEPITKTPKITLEKTATFPKLDLLHIPKLITKNNEQELSNHIEKRKKRSTHAVLQEFENRPSPPPMMLQDGQLISAQINENHRQNSDTPMSAFTPFSDTITNVRENNAEKEFFFNNKVGQRSAASKFSHFVDRNTQLAKLGEKDNFLNENANHRSSAPILLEFPPFINIRGNELKQEKFVTDTLGQKSAESTLSQFLPYTDKTINIREGKEEKNNILNDIGDQRSAAEILSQFPPFTDKTINIREGKEEKNNILNDISDQPSAADILSQFPPFTDKTINIREGKEEKNNILNDIGDQRSAADILSQFPPFTDKTINIRGGKEEKNNILNDIGDQPSAADILSQFPPFSDNTANVRGDNVEQDNFLNDEQTPAGSILLQFPPFTDRTVNVRKEGLSKNHFLNDDNGGQRSDVAMLSEFSPFTDIRRERTEYDTVLNDNNGQRSSSIKLQESPPFTEKTTNVREDRRQQGGFLELKDSVQEQTQTGTFPQKQKTKHPLICTAKTQKEVELEKRKMDELQEEVKKLNELVALLKDQQKIINIFSDVDKYWENEANKKGYSENTIENSFLYQTLKQLQNNRIANRVNTLTRYDQEDNSNTQVGKFGKLENHIQDPIPTFKDLERIKMDLRVTAENLNKTKEALMIEKQKENKFEQELKRQSSELKFLKAMTENLYDKMGNKYDDKTDQKLRSSDFKDLDVDSLLASVHTPKTMPAASHKQSSVSSESPPNSMGTETGKKLESLSLIHDYPIDFTKPLTRDELLFIEHNNNYDKLMEKWSEDKAFVDYLGKNLMIDYGNDTLKGLRELAKQEKNTYKKFFPNTKSRESNPEDNQDTNMHDFLTHLKLEGSKNDNGHYNSQKINQNKENAFQEKFQKNLNKGNNTYLPMIARASSSGKMDDIDFKLKLLEMLTREEKSDDTIIKEKALNEAMKQLLAPEKKSDDDQLTTLMALLKEKRDGPNFGSESQENLKKLFIELNMKPQSKNDDIDIEKELRQLQRAINSLKPKEDSLFNNMDLDNFLNNGKGKQNGDIQSMLSQMVAQNSESATSPMGVDATGARPNLGGNTDPAIQELLSQYLATSNTASHKNKINYGPTSSYSGSPYANFYEPNSNLIDSNINSYGVVPSSYHPNPPNPYIPNSIYGLGTNSYQANTKSYGPNSKSYGKDFNLYNPNSNIYASNIRPYGPRPNSYAYSLHPYGSNLYSPSPYSNPYYNSKTYGPNSDSYGSPYGFDNLGSDTSSFSYENEYLGQKEYGARPAFLDPYSSGNYKFPNPFIGYSRAPSYVPNPYQFNYATSKSGYSPSSYSNLAFGGYPGSTQGAIRYQTGDPSGTASQKYGSKDYTSAGTSYDKYSGVPQGNQAVYGSTIEQDEAGVYQNYGKRFFPAPRPFTNTAANYQGNSYGTKGYARPSMDQPYGNGQNDNQYKESLAADLVKQIESLESAIKGLSRRDYTQTPADKATVASLDQRIYELKGVISSLNQPSYGPQPSSYQKNSIPYGSKPPETMFVQNQESYQPQQLNSAPYGGMSQNGSPQNAYGPSSQTVYKPTTISGQIQSSNGHNSYSSSNASPPQLPYDSNSQTQITYANASPPQASNPQPNYPPNQPSSSSYNPKQSTQHSNSPQSYQTGPQGDTYPPTQPASSPLYQPKAALREDRRLPHGMHPELQELRNTGSEKSRRVRQINDMEAPRIPPRAALYENDDAGVTTDPRQGFGGEQNRPVERPIGYNLGDDTLTQIANIFKKYLEENLTPDENGNMPQQYPPTNNQESRNSAVATLQEKLDLLKKQLGSPPQYEKSLSNYFVRPSVAYYYPPSPIPYGSNNMLNQFKISGITSLEKTFSDKKQDVFTQIVLKILEKVLGALPSVLSRLFGNLATSVGNSYGDNYSPLQNVFKNLGAVGFMPLILIRLLDTINVIVQHLGKNKFFKKFLLPGGVVAGAGLVILFLVYFFQQDEPYGYIDYQGNNYKHPKYESSSYGHDNYGATDYNNNGNYRSNPPLPDYDNNLYGNNMKQVLDGENLGTYNNPIFNSKGIDNNRGGEEEVPLQYSRGYYDFDRYNIRTYNKPNFNRRSSDSFNDGGSSIAPVQYSKGYYDYIKNPKTFHDPHLDDKSIGNFNDGEGNVPLQHSKGYYDYFEERFIPNRNKDVYR